MARPRIIIADTDESYIAPLQLKFAKVFFELADIEIITDQVYFKDLFSKPQKVDILIVSEDLYNAELQKHSITNIFLMVEQYEEEINSVNVVRLFKYTSIKEIFNKIISRSSMFLNIAGNDKNKKETQIIMVTSASGGVGKTTIALGISRCLASDNKRVLYINANRLQSFGYLLNNQSRLTEQDLYKQLVNNRTNIYDVVKHVIRNEGFFYLPAFKAALITLGLDFDIYKDIAVSAKKSRDFEFIIIDAESAFDESKISLIDLSDKVMLVTEQSSGFIESANAFISNIDFSNSDKFIFICNKFDKDSDNALISYSTTVKFHVSEYVDKMEEKIRQNIELLSKNKAIKKITYLLN